MDRASGAIKAGATAFLALANLAVGGWVAIRCAALAQPDAAHERMRAAAQWWLDHLDDRARLCHAEAVAGVAALAGFAALLA